MKRDELKEKILEASNLKTTILTDEELLEALVDAVIATAEGKLNKRVTLKGWGRVFVRSAVVYAHIESVVEDLINEKENQTKANTKTLDKIRANNILKGARPSKPTQQRSILDYRLEIAEKKLNQASKIVRSQEITTENGLAETYSLTLDAINELQLMAEHIKRIQARLGYQVSTRSR